MGKRMKHVELKERLRLGRVEEGGKVCDQLPNTSCRCARGQEPIAAVVLPERNISPRSWTAQR